MNISEKFWDRLANGFDKQSESYRPSHIKTVENAKKHLKANDLVLDYGCATGLTAIEIADRVKEVHGIDFSPKMIEAAKRKAVELSIPNINFMQATIFDRRLKKESFDVILALGILHLLKNPVRVIQRINELLKPGGVFISATACMGNNRTVPIVINTVLFIPGRIGIFPYFNFPKIPHLERSITLGKFQILETETLSFDARPVSEESYIVAHFIAAKKIY